MGKLKDDFNGALPPIGNDGLLRFIDEINVIRARSGNRYRFKPNMRHDGVLEMVEWCEIKRPDKADKPSHVYAGHARIGHG
jgi:hypothetical protein